MPEQITTEEKANLLDGIILHTFEQFLIAEVRRTDDRLKGKVSFEEDRRPVILHYVAGMAHKAIDSAEVELNRRMHWSRK